jgi:hypothetical protein
MNQIKERKRRLRFLNDVAAIWAGGGIAGYLTPTFFAFH